MPVAVECSGSQITSLSEMYVDDGAVIRREIAYGGGTSTDSKRRPDNGDLSPAGAFEIARLRERKPPLDAAGGPFAIVDAFSGCGGLSLGVHEAVRVLGWRPETVLALDTNEPSMAVFSDNFNPSRVMTDPIEKTVSGAIGSRLSLSERELKRDLGRVDLLVGGPPCQGHSDLNNHSRRNDPKNFLYGRMARLAEVLNPRAILIENVPGAVHDHNRIVQRTQSELIENGYEVTEAAIRADEVGAPQKRRRHFTVALRDSHVGGFHEHLEAMKHAPLSVMSAIGDLLDFESDRVFDTSAKHSATNQARIEYLFDNDLYDLPDDQRPDCHRLKPHSYKSVYGRLRPDEPAPTITSGFGSTGQGRFVHPLRPRSLTPHEAARLQGFPDWFSFESANQRGALQEMIGNAVPFRLAFAVSLALLVGIK